MERDDVIVFLGPTLSVSEARQLLDADYRMPANRGDVYRASRSEPQIIVLIDGAFESEAAVLHNEILWALSKGIDVLGAASIGALRAAELAPFGMIGVGKIFQDYRDGMLERDDAVAVVHGPAEVGYPLLSTPLVDVWATLDRAFEFQVLSMNERKILRDLSAGMFYKQLGMQALIKKGVQMGYAIERAKILEQYVTAQGVFSQKREDAIEVLRLISDERYPPSTALDFAFERTSAWEKLVAEQEQDDRSLSPKDSVFDTELELAAIGLGLAEKEVQRRGYVIGPAEFQQTAHTFRHKHELRKFSDVQRWMECAGFEHDDYVKLIEDEFLIQQSRALTQNRLQELILRVDRRRRSALSNLRMRQSSYSPIDP
jgi:hypothetical protein